MSKNDKNYEECELWIQNVNSYQYKCKQSNEKYIIDISSNSIIILYTVQ